MLDKECCLIDALVINKWGQAIASEGFGSKDEFPSSVAAEPHLWQEGVDGGTGKLVELDGCKRPGGQSIADAGQVDVFIAHEGLVVSHVAMGDAFRDLVAFDSFCVERF